ncbi:MAG TPA: ROK family protein [Spirochaetales bacterium]|nr:ROK family protein [Spirochaetales bacterium]HRY54033.1 ROK family protein [Spirochaetia bacterium]HRZ63413.1 ROK family protein [Spirochaetia bacterium]
MPKDGRVYVGADLGATKILAAVFDSSMKPLATEKAKTPREASAKAVVAALAETVRRALAASGADAKSLAGVGVAVPGPLDRARGIVRYTPNMGFKDYALGSELAGLFGAPAFLDNDVQAGVYGELRAGALRGKRNAVGVFVGTGIGGGIVIDGKVYRGSTGSAGEVGHMTLLDGGALCGCGNYGCLEALASRGAMAKDALALAAAGKAPGMLDAAGTDIRKYRSSAIASSIESGDKSVRRAVDRAAYWLGVGLANIVHLLNPEAIVIGGGIATRFGERYLERALASMEEHLMPGLSGSAQVLLSELGDLAVPTGAAYPAAEAAGGAAP